MFGAPSSSPFGAPAPAFGQPAPAPAFGAPSTGGFGAPAPAFGQPAPAPAFGAPAPVFGAPSTGGFGQPQNTGGFGHPAPAPAFGAAPATGGLFGSAPTPAPSFGKPAGGSLFGAAPAPATGGLFGAPAPATGGLFGAAPTPAPFGSPAPATPFGAPAAAPTAFGAPAPAFGAPAPSAFGAASTPSAFGQPQQQQTQTGSTVAPYQRTTKQDGNNSITLLAITAMPQYENKSFEQLRLEDYLAGNKGTKGQAAPATSGFGAAPAFGQPAPAPAFGAPAPATGGLFGSAPAPAFGQPAPAPAFGAPAPASGGLFGSAPAPAFGQPAPAPAFGAPAPATGGLFGSAPAPAPSGGLFGAAPTPAPFGAAPAPATGGLFGSPAPAFGAPQPAPAFGAPAPATGGLFGAPAPAPSTGGLFGAPAPAPATGGLFGSTPAPATGGLFGQPAPAPTGGLFGAPTPAKPGGLFGSAPAPATGGLFGQPAPAPTGGLFGAPMPAPSTSLFGTTPSAAQTVPMAPPPSADAILAQQLAAVENQQKQLELLDAWRGKPPSGSKVIPTSQYDTDGGNGWNGAGSSYAASSSALLSYRAAPRSTAKIRPRGYTPTQHSPSTTLVGRKTGSPILSPNRFVGSATKTLFIKPNSLTPKPKTRLLLTNGVSNGTSPSPAVLQNGNTVPSQELNGHAPTNGSKPTPVDSPRTAGSPSTPAHDFYRHVVDDSGASPSASSPFQTEKKFVPKLSKHGYNVYPSIAELEAMSEADLAAVAGFKVERPGYGSVEWDGAVDVRGVDIDAVVVIESKNVSVYDEAEEKDEKPQRGSKLNRPAVITMQDVYPKDGAESSTEAKEKLKRKIEKSTKKMGAELLSFDTESGVWTFRVGHFSRYGLDDDDDSDEEESDEEVKATPSLETTDDEQESLKHDELGGTSRIYAPMDEDESTAYTETSATETLNQDEADEDTHVHEIVRASEEAYAMMTEEVLHCNYEEAIIPIEPFENEVEEEEKLLFPNEAVHDITLPSKLPLKARGPISHSSRSTGICSRLARKSGLKKMSSANVDYGLRMRGSFRVGWRPDGSFIQLKPSKGSSQVLVQSRPVIAPTQSSTSIPLLQTHQKHSVKTGSDGDNESPIFTLPKHVGSPGNNLVDALEDYSKVASNATQKAVPYSFSLLVSLFGEDQTSNDIMGDSRRLESVSNWLRGVVSSDTKEAISTGRSSGDIYESIFAALSGGDFATASSLALDSNPRLSLMLASTGAQAQPFCESQLEMWNKSGAQSFTPTGILRIFSLASGSIDIERQMYKSDSVSYNIDWRRRFGMYLWSANQPSSSSSVSSIVQQYGSDVESGLAPPPTPLYCDGSTTNSNQCILYQVLNHYQDEDMPLADIITPSSHSPFQHDFSTTFHLCASLSALSSSTLSQHQETLIVDSVASQLISEGSWEWAVYASLCFVGSGTFSRNLASARQLRARKIISRFYAPSIDPSAERRRLFLQSMGIPEQWFVEAHAYRSASEGDVFRMIDNLIRFSPKESMVALETLLIPNMVLDGKESRKQLLSILESLKSRMSDDHIDLWSKPSGCGTIHNVLELQAQVDKLSNMSLVQVESSGVNIDQLLGVATELETTISKALDNSFKTPTFFKIRYGFTMVPRRVVFAEVGMMLSTIHARLLALKSGQKTTMSQSSSSQPSFVVAPGGLYDSSPLGAESTLRELCSFKAMT